MAVDAKDAIAALDQLITDLEHATKAGVGEGADMLQGIIRENAPHLSGELATSVAVTGPYPVVGGYIAKVGPTLIYGRIRELGGRIPGSKTVMTHPYLRWFQDGKPIFAKSVHQRGSRYVLRSYEIYKPQHRNVLMRHWANAMRMV